MQETKDAGLIPGLGRSPRAGHGNSLQYSCLENPMDRRAWQAIGYGVARVGHDLMTKPPPPLWSKDCVCVCARTRVQAQSFRPVWLFATPWTVTRQAPWKEMLPPPSGNLCSDRGDNHWRSNCKCDEFSCQSGMYSKIRRGVTNLVCFPCLEESGRASRKKWHFKRLGEWEEVI